MDLKALFRRFSHGMEPWVFLPAAAVVVAFVAFGAIFTEAAQALFNSLQSSIVETFGWFYILTATLLLVFTLWLAASRYGDFRLGGKDSRPEFSYAAWFSMLLSASMGIGRYPQTLPAMSFDTNPGGENGWHEKWTLFYWSWWISWSPFVGVFVARVSKGRTIREFLVTALLVPTLGSFIWFAALGATGLDTMIAGGERVANLVRDNEALALFAVLDTLPLTQLSWSLPTLLVIVFSVTSSDSGSFLDDMVTSGGHPNPPRLQRVFWAVAEGTVAAVLLYAGGLTALRSASLATGLPIAIFLLVASVGLLRALQREKAASGVPDVADLGPQD